MGKTYRIDAEVLFDGINDPIKSGTIIFDQNKITYVGTTEGAPNGDIQLQSNTVIPGLWDSHVHYFGVKGASEMEWNLSSSFSRAARAAYDARAAIESGFTSTREVGGIGLKLRDAINDGTIPGPHIYAAGEAMGITGGHADAHDFPLDFVYSRAKEHWGSLGPVDGPWEAVKAVRAQFREGADLIKVMGSGGVMSQRDSPMHQEFADAELRAIVEEAESKERIVAAHVHGAAGIAAALRTGVKTIEHGTWLDEDLCNQMIENDAILVPTIFIQKRLHEKGREFGASEAVMEKIAVVVKRHQETMKLAFKKGVSIAMGTDIYSSGPDSLVPWGMNAKELEYYVDIGMSNKEALVTATSMGPKTLGPRAPKSGVLKEGFDADVLLLQKNPLDDITILQDKENIAGVFKSGKLEVNWGLVS
ncbi:MAG: amidohydrolase family protein [Candidatus Kariarchaeaceae archaeon]|jgi:imidazolonepropionase-like amidohydrolase